MLNASRKTKQFFALYTAAAVVVTVNIAVGDSEQSAIASEVDQFCPICEAGIVAAPAEITGIEAPVVEELASLEDTRLRVPELSAPALPEPAMPDLELIVWGSDGVIPAPTAVVEVEAPDVGSLASLEDAGSRGHGLVEPPLPKPAMPDLELIVWGSDDVIPAPTAVIEVEAPDVGNLASLEDAGSRGHGLVEPPLPTPGN